MQEFPYTKRGKPLKKRPRKKHYNNTKTRKKPTPRYRSTRDYDFLTYIRVVFKWATENTGLSRPHIELLLYLYPRGTFTKSDFFEYHKLIGIYQIKTFKSMIDEGWIYMWRPRKNNESALYALTNKAKTICSKMHQFCVGDKDIPTTKISNKVAASSERVDGYYMDFIKKMNKERDKKNRDEE